MIVVHLLGLAAFAWPFLASAAGGAPVLGRQTSIAVALAALGLLGLALRGRLTAQDVALLGVLAAVNAILRLPGSFGGASLMFVLPILCGRVFGARFAFTLGATSMLASAVLTGGIGPWLPFQMWALGWVGAAAAFVPRRTGRAGLAAYGWVAGFAFGLVMNLWFWPFQGGVSELSYSADAGIVENLAAYGRFYLVSSLAWDATRAAGNAVLVVVLARPVGMLLQESGERLSGRWVASSA